MSKLKFTQTELYNILVAEVESLKITKGEYTKLLMGVSEHLKRLEELYNKPMAVDIEEMRAEHESIKSTLESGIYIPKWLGITFLSLLLGFGASLFVNYRQYITNQDQLDYIGEANSYIEKLEAKLPKGKPRK